MAYSYRAGAGPYMFYSDAQQGGVDSGVTSGMQSLVSNYNQAYGKAKAANEQRYQQLLNIANQTTNQRAADIRTDASGQQSDVMQQLARLGMQNTTVAPTMTMGIEREKQASLNRNADQMQQTKLGIIERREDKYPDLASLQSTLGGISSQLGSDGIASMLKILSGIKQ